MLRLNGSEGQAKILKSHSFAALEFWFFKVNAGPVALIVDWIARRRTGEFWVRASIHTPDRHETLFDKQSARPGNALVGMDSHHSSGQVGDVRWELEIDPGVTWIAPDIFPARLTRMADLTLVSAPNVAFTGSIWHGNQHAALTRAPGMISHYWGRQLAPEWWWVSANAFDRPGVAVECSILRTGVWGIPVGLPLAYLYLRHPGGESLVISPPARATVTGTPEAFEITFAPLTGAPITLRATGRGYTDFGERIVNTLVGDLEIQRGGQLLATAHGTAGLERRSPA